MSRPKKYTTEIRVCLTPELNALLGKRAAEEKRGKSDLVRLILERVLLGTPAAPTPEKSSPTMKPPPEGRIAFTPKPREDDEEKYPWRKYSLTEEEWGKIPFEDQEAIKRGQGQVLKRRRF